MNYSRVSLITALVVTIMFVAPFSSGVTLKDSSASVRDGNHALSPSHNRQAVSPGARASANPGEPQATTQAARVIGKIAFASDRDGNFEIYTMDADEIGRAHV